MQKAIRRLVVVLMLPEAVSLLIELVSHIVQMMTNNAHFPSPDPTLAQVSTAIEELDRAQTASKARTKGSADLRDEKKVILKALADRLRAYVQGIADANPPQAKEIIEGSGMKAKRYTPPSHPLFKVTQGKVSGEVILVVRRGKGDRSYDWQYSTDEKTWTSAPSTVRVKTTISGLTPGVTYFFRFRAVGRGGVGEWSQTIAFLVK